MSLTVRTCARSIAALLTADTEIGTSTSRSSRRCAVTTISPSTGAALSAASPSGSSCAITTDELSAVAAMTAQRAVLRNAISPPSPTAALCGRPYPGFFLLGPITERDDNGPSMAIKRAIVTTLFTLVANRKPGGGTGGQSISLPEADFSRHPKRAGRTEMVHPTGFEPVAPRLGI